MPDGIRSWALTVCGACVLGALLSLLFPDGSYKKQLRLLLSLILLYTIFQPLRSLNKWSVNGDKSQFDPSQYENVALQSELERQAKTIYTSYLEENLCRILDDSDISYENITVMMDNSDDGRISIGQVEVMVKKKDEAQTAQIKRLLQPYIGEEPVVKIQEL